jgi:hypothetical protein
MYIIVPFFRNFRKKWLNLEKRVKLDSAAAVNTLFSKERNNMGEHYSAVAPRVQDHLKNLVNTAGLPDNEESLELLAKGWLEKQSSFHDQTQANDMEEVDVFEIEDERGALIMTYSGSLLMIGPETEDGRVVEYASIGMRKDVPESLNTEGSVLAKDIDKDSAVEFEIGPVKTSSPVYAIAVVDEKMSVEEEEELLSDVTLILTEDFVEINRTFVDDEA